MNTTNALPIGYTDDTVNQYAAPGVPSTLKRPKPTFFQATKSRLATFSITLINLATFFAIWEYIAYKEYLPAIFFPAPSAVAVELWNVTKSGLLWYHFSFSIVNLIAGFTLSVLVGVPLGMALGTFKRFNMIMSPYYWSINSMPRIAIWPLLVLWGGFTIKVKIVLIFISAIMPILINTMSGVITVDPVLVRVGRVLGASRGQLYVKIVLPYTMPFILSGLTQGMSRGLVALMVSEMLGSGRGLGYVVVRSVEEFNPARVFGMLFVLVVISLLIVSGGRWVENHAVPWRKMLDL
jgi:ABC-type nitrate/sulfonate/bicarbonate transport system permease component